MIRPGVILIDIGLDGAVRAVSNRLRGVVERRGDGGGQLIHHILPHDGQAGIGGIERAAEIPVVSVDHHIGTRGDHHCQTEGGQQQQQEESREQSDAALVLAMVSLAA